MGREIKRVSLDFDFFKPGIENRDKIWPGYLNQHYKQCEHCEGSGTTSARKRLEEIVRLIMISAEDARRGKCHPYFNQLDCFYYTGGEVVSSDMIELSTGLAKRAPSPPIGHDGIDTYRATNEIVMAAGLDKEWGFCKECNGEGLDPSCKEAYDNWERTEPPSGEGYQLWSTTTEGHPMTPVFDTPEKLARYCADNNVSSFGSSTETYETWLKWIKSPGWAPSMVANQDSISTGVGYVAADSSERTGDQ